MNTKLFTLNVFSFINILQPSLVSDFQEVVHVTVSAVVHSICWLVCRLSLTCALVHDLS